MLGKKFMKKLEIACELANEAGYMNEAMLRQAGFGWFMTAFIAFAIKRDNGTVYWYYSEDLGRRYDYLFQVPTPYRKAAELQWALREDA